jgi:hypothetical protein
MKLKQGYTLSQFIDYVDETYLSDDYKFAKYVCMYNKLLKQPLKQEQFFNPIEDPTTESFKNSVNCPLIISYEYKKLVKDFQEAEKKVIFEGWKINTQNKIYNDEYKLILITNRLETKPDKHGSYRYWKNIETIGDLFDVTQGQLKTKNLEI